MQYEWRMCAGLLREMKITADDLDIPLVILAIPNAHLVSPRWVDFLQQRGCEVNDRMTTSRIVNDWLADFCIQEGIPWIDPLTTFRQRQGVGEELYLQTDDHMTPAGYALLGEALADGLASELKAKKNQP
jgi:lysophospholipase L1-like esterase